MFSKAHSKTVTKNQVQTELAYVYYDANAKQFVSTDRNIMLIEPTEEELTDSFFDAKTQQPIKDEWLSYPDYQKIIPTAIMPIVLKGTVLQNSKKRKFVLFNIDETDSIVVIEYRNLSIMKQFLGKGFQSFITKTGYPQTLVLKNDEGKMVLIAGFYLNPNDSYTEIAQWSGN